MLQDLVKRSGGVLEPYPGDASRLTLFKFGFKFPYLGLRYLVQYPDIMRWILIPVFLNVVLVVVAFLAATWGAPLLLVELWPEPSGGFALTVWQFMVMGLGLVLFVLGVILMYAISGIIGAPFYDYLSARVEMRITGVEEESLDWPQFWRDVAQSVAHSLFAFSLWICAMLPLFCLGVVPGIGQIIELVLGLSFTALFLSREMMDGPMSRRRYRFRRKLRIVRSQLPLMLGFGMACAGLLWVPLLNFVFMPVSIVGGTLLFLTIESNGFIVD